MADSKAVPLTKDRVVGCNLDNYIVRALFNEFVPLACIKEGHAALWPLNTPATKHLTSDWAAIKWASNFLSVMLDASGGRVPNQTVLHQQFIQFLANQEVKWSVKHSELCIRRLRSMLQSLLALKRCKTQKQPHEIIPNSKSSWTSSSPALKHPP